MTNSMRPTFQPQGPSTNCVIDGKNLGWLSCTSYAMAMAIDAATFNVKTPSGCAVRRGTGDTVGGLTLNQVAYVADNVYGVKVDVRVGNNVVSPSYAATQAQAGRGLVLQGFSGAMNGTKFRSTGTGVNHAVYVNSVRGGTSGKPEEALVYDPAADGRTVSWGKADQGPSWWPWSLVLKFAAGLHPWGEGDPRVLGSGKFYVALMPDHEPHAHFKFGGVRTTPFPDRTRASETTVNVHASPTTSSATVVGKLSKGDLFTAYQKTTKGDLFHGSRVWYGDHNGTRWVHEARLNYKGGST